MAVNYASKYSQNVDERFSTGSLTNGIVNGEFDWIGVSTVNVYSIPTSAMNDYSLSGTNRYGTPEELGNETQEMTLKQDRSFTFTIDRKNYDDTMMVMEAGKALRRQIDEVVIPEVDTYRISTLVAGAPVANVKTLATTKENAYEEFLAVQGILDDNEAPQFGRVVLCTPAYYNKIKLDESFTKKGDMATQIAITGIVGDIDGVPVIKAPTNRFPKNVDFIITNAIVMPSPVKLQEYKIHTDAPGISGWLVEGRVRYDAFVLKEKAWLVFFLHHLIEHCDTDIVRIFVIFPDSLVGSLYISDWRSPFVPQLKLCDLRSHIVLYLNIDFRTNLFDSIINRLNTTLIIQQELNCCAVLLMYNQGILKHFYDIILRDLRYICKYLFSSKLHDNPPLSALHYVNA